MLKLRNSLEYDRVKITPISLWSFIDNWLRIHENENNNNKIS